MANSIFLQPAVQSGSTELLPDGSVSAPALAFVDDQTTGLYRIGTSNVGFAAGGALAFDYTASRLKLASGVTLDWNATTIDATDIAKIDGITNGTGAAAKALVLDANGDITAGLRALVSTRLALGTTAAIGAQWQNTTAAAAGAQQVSPSSRWTGQGWKTDATAASQAVDFQAYVLPVQGAAAPSGSWKLDAAINGGAFSNVLTMSSGGSLTITSNITIGSSGAVTFSSKSSLLSPADGQLNLRKNDASAGVGFDVTSDAILAVRTTAQSAYATVSALAYRAGSGSTAGVTAGPFTAVLSIQTVGGIVTVLTGS